ncbi:MAG: thrombospondin type 3 repeat-containing protein, partial [Bradymonadaceae bacterium]
MNNSDFSLLPGVPDASPRPLALPCLSVLFCVALALPACMLNFDEFEPGQVGQPPDSTHIDPDATGADTIDFDGDTDPNQPDDTDTSDPEDTNGSSGDTDTAPPWADLAIGDACESDVDCGDAGTCMEGYCTKPCTFDDCPGGSTCQAIGEQRWCVASCTDDYTCDHIAGRDDLGCVDLVHFPFVGSGAQVVRACLPDVDGDRVYDGEDNCLDDRNPTQVDSDGDGIGDACDPEPFCHSASSDGILLHDAIDFRAGTFSAPDMINGSWLPIFGGATEAGDLSDDLRILDRAALTWSEGTLPYPARRHGVAPSLDGSFISTPGEHLDGSGQPGLNLRLTADADAELAFAFGSALHEPTLMTTSLGVLYVHGYTEARDTNAGRWSLRRFDPATRTYSNVRTVTEGNRVGWHAVRDLQGHAIFYSGPEPSIGVGGRLVRALPTGTATTAYTVTYPALPGSENNPGPAFDPFILPAPGGQLFAFDRNTGIAARLILDNTLGTASGQRLPVLDLDIDLEDVHFVAMPNARGFILIGRPAGEPDKLVIKEHFFACLPGINDLDTDGDGVADILDNCPFQGNPEQEDADQDSLGDVCDPDRDGDGIPNEDDFILDAGSEVVWLDLDTDNDGIPNHLDDDIDGDGIPNDQDRFPFDTFNDGIPNRWAVDSDGDGYPDVVEWAAGTSATNPLSFPRSGEVVYVRDTGQVRTLELARIDAIHDEHLVNVTQGKEAHWPRFTPQGGFLVFMLDEPGQATEFGRASGHFGATVAPQTFNLGIPLRTVVPYSESSEDAMNFLASVLAVHERIGQPGRWDISRVDLIPSIVFNPLSVDFSQISSADLDGSSAYFLAAPQGCPACSTAYRYNLIQEPPMTHQLPLVPDGPTRIRRTNLGEYYVAPASDGSGTSAYIRSASTLTELRPPQVKEVNSVVPLIADGHLLVSAAIAGESYDLWLYNGLTHTWIRVLRSDDD